MTTDPDRALARAARRGNRRALERLYDGHRRRVFSFLVRLLGDRTQAEDAFQEVWIKVLNGLQSYDPEAGTFRAWLNRIAHNAAIDRRRRESHYASAAELDAPVDETGQTGVQLLVSKETAPDRAGETRERAERLARHLAVLPERQRAAVLLRHQQGLTYAEIARALGIPEGTAKTAVHRGVRALRARSLSDERTGQE